MTKEYVRNRDTLRCFHYIRGFVGALNRAKPSWWEMYCAFQIRTHWWWIQWRWCGSSGGQRWPADALCTEWRRWADSCCMTWMLDWGQPPGTGQNSQWQDVNNAMMHVIETVEISLLYIRRQGWSNKASDSKLNRGFIFFYQMLNLRFHYMANNFLNK